MLMKASDDVLSYRNYPTWLLNLDDPRSIPASVVKVPCSAQVCLTAAVNEFSQPLGTAGIGGSLPTIRPTTLRRISGTALDGSSNSIVLMPNISILVKAEGSRVLQKAKHELQLFYLNYD
jgi:hypothetical protein